jgi:hypothetical protein
MIYPLGNYIESNKFIDDIATKSEGTGLPATDDLAAQIRALQLQLKALAAASTHRDKRNSYLGSGSGRGGARGYGSNTRMCYGCGEMGHNRRDGSTESDYNAVTLAVGFHAVFVSLSFLSQDEYIILAYHYSVCPYLPWSLGWIWALKGRNMSNHEPPPKSSTHSLTLSFVSSTTPSTTSPRPP